MTSKDKTGDQLVASIRATKAKVAKKPAAAKTSTRKGSKPPARSPKAAPKKPKARATGSQDPYQAGRRVWPD